MAALPNSPVVAVEEYLNTSYDPDVEYVDGVLVERNVGDWWHAIVQLNVGSALKVRFRHLKVATELRSQTRTTRFRLPDVCAVLRAPEGRYLAEAAYLVAEVLSKDDRMSELLEKLDEYRQKGVANIWLFDPRRKLMFVYRNGTLVEVVEDTICTEDGEVWLTRSEIFAE